MFKAAKELRSSLIRNSLKSFVVAPLIKKFEVCAVRAICIGTVNKENIRLQRRKMEKLWEDNEHIVCFFSCITAMVENKKAKAGKRRNDSGSSERTQKKLVVIIVAFLSGLYLISLNMAIRHFVICRTYIKRIFDGRV